MQDNASEARRASLRASPARPPARPATARTGSQGAGPGGLGAPGTGRPRRRGLVTSVIAIAAGTAVGFGLFAVVAGLLSSGPSAPKVPAPPPTSKMFIEDDNGTGADNQQNILEATAPGLVHIVSPRGVPVGVGMVLTSSGMVLTSAQVVGRADRVTVRLVLSGRAFPARVVGVDAAADLALLRMAGGSGFKAVAIGNSRDIAADAVVTAVGSSGMTKTLVLDVGDVTSLNASATIGGARLSGLLQTTTRILPGQETGGPVVNLSGQAVGIAVAGSGSGVHGIGFAIPINKALAIARQLAARGA
jgi:S1-C subfamily serine protease